MIIKRLSPKANPNNALQLTAETNLCGDGADVAIVDYTATVPVISTTRVTTIRLGAVDYPLNGSYDPNQPREVTALKTDIERVVRTAGYATSGCVDAKLVSTNLIVTLKDSSLVANTINTTVFVASNSRNVRIPA